MNPLTHVYLASLHNMTGAYGDLHPLLDLAEQHRSASHVHFKDQLRYTLSRALLKILLGHHLSVPAHRIQVQVGPMGKPFVDGHALPITFNTSHSGNQVALCISMSMEVGIDIETVDVALDYHEILNVVATPREQQHILQNGRRAFYEMWTRKEALLKCMGTGFLERPTTHDVLDSMVWIKSQPYKIMQLNSDDHCCLALALQTASMSTAIKISSIDYQSPQRFKVVREEVCWI